MEIKEIQKQVNNAVRIFKETLEKTYLKKGKEKAFYGIGTHWFTSFLCGNVNILRLKNENLKISGELPKVTFNKKCKGLPFKFNDFDIFPMVITLFNKDIGKTQPKERGR